MLKNRKHAKSLLAALLAMALFLTFGAGTAWAAENSVHKEILDTGVKDRSPEYYELSKMWNNYFLDFLPDSSQPEVLERLTTLPAYDDTEAWEEYFHDGDPVLMRDEAYRVARQLGVAGSGMSNDEKIKRILEWRNDDWKTGFQQSVFARQDPYAEKYDGRTYDCTTISEGPVTVCRIAGVPALSIGMSKSGRGHEEAFFYDGNIWRHISGATFSDYLRNIDVFQVDGFITYGPETVYGLEKFGRNGTAILDLNESWIDEGTEMFMLKLLRQPYVYPEKKLTRGEVAKLLCNYIGTVPMKNDQIFSDVPVSHDYSPYIWAMNKLGIMGGVGDNKFNPDAELTMQEFAVMAMRVVEYGGEKKVAHSKAEIERIQSDPVNWPPDLAYTQGVIERLKKEADWKAGISILPNPIVFADNDKIASWAKPAVDEFSKLSILQGNSATNPQLGPTEPLSRTRFLVFLHKFEQKLQLAGYGGGTLF